VQIVDTIGQAAREGEAAVKRVLAEEKMEHRLVFSQAGFPISVGHGQLVHVGQQRLGAGPVEE